MDHAMEEGGDIPGTTEVRSSLWKETRKSRWPLAKAATLFFLG